MSKRFYLLAIAATFATANQGFGQIADNTVFFDLDFTANDQIVSEPDAAGAFTEGPMSDGPFVDGNLVGNGGQMITGQQGFGGSASTTWTVDTTEGTATSAGPSGAFLTGNIFKGQPLISVGDVVRLESEVSFTKSLVNGAETNSGPFYFFGFRAGAGGMDFHPNQGISQALAYNLGADPVAADPTDSSVQARLVGDGASAPENALGNVEDAGMDFAASDFTTDVLTVRSDAEYISADGTFEVTTSLWNGGTQLGSDVVSTVTDPDIASAMVGNRIQFAIRDGAPGVTDLKIHRLAAIFNPNDSAIVIGDFDGDGDVDCDDLDGYIGNIGAAATGALAALDFDSDGSLSQNDANSVITTLVVAGGVAGTFPGDLNCDGTVDVLGDAFPLVANLSSAVTTYAQGDLNFSGAVDVLGDAFILVANLGNTNQ